MYECLNVRGNQLNQTIVKVIASAAFALVLVLGACWQAQAQDAKERYPRMAPLEQYLMADRNAEIAWVSPIPVSSARVPTAG